MKDLARSLVMNDKSDSVGEPAKHTHVRHTHIRMMHTYTKRHTHTEHRDTHAQTHIDT